MQKIASLFSNRLSNKYLTSEIVLFFGSFICCVISFIVLFIFLQTQTIQIAHSSIQEPQDNFYTLQGNINTIKESSALYSVSLSYSCQDTILVFKDGTFNLENNSVVRVLVAQEEFRGNKQLIAHKIEVIS